MIVSVPDPVVTRRASLAELERLGLPTPPERHPMVWEPADRVSLRPAAEIEARMAILNVVLARSFGMPSDLAVAWLRDAHLMERLTGAEWDFVVSGKGDPDAFAQHFDALFALAWLVGISMDLDPARPSAEGLTGRLPHLPDNETFEQWRRRTLAAPVEPRAAAGQLDLYYCLDWAYLESERRQIPLPGLIDSNTIGQRRWALEWAVILHGAFHGPPSDWDEIDLTG
jgi:hypothetical protein